MNCWMTLSVAVRCFPRAENSAKAKHSLRPSLLQFAVCTATDSHCHCRERSEAPLPCGLTHREVYSLLSREITPEASIQASFQASFLRSWCKIIFIYQDLSGFTSILHVLIFLVFEEMTPRLLPSLFLVRTCVLDILDSVQSNESWTELDGVGFSWIFMLQLSSTDFN